ncbi:Spc24 subunit of Ndc80-domain-containing protein [Cladorrhinum sp. PSN259]|nr:Spc24 subunit of Ndc80-domain-containing protein [Cladorrhinum sp. PSN259]
MLLEDPPSKLISHTVQNFNIAPDKTCVARISESLSDLNQARDYRLREVESSLKKLSRTLSTLSSQHNEVVSSHSSTQHASQISKLDTQKFRIAKGVSDLEMETERLQAQLAELTSRLEELEMQGVDGGDTGNGAGGGGALDDEVLLRLKVYRSLGIEIERDGKGDTWNKVVVRNDRRGDVHVVNVDNRKFSRFWYANYFWDNL